MRPELDAPQYVRDRMVKYGGKNPFGKPTWRVVLCQNVFVKRGGVFHQMPTGEITQFSVGAGGRVEYTPVRADSVQSGVMEVPKYPGKGWILERWLSASLWGTREWWNAQRGDDGSPLLGPYPNEGDYWLIAGPFENLPAISDLEGAIAMYEHQQRNKPADLETFMKVAIKNEEDRIVANRLRLEKTLEEMRRSELMPVLKSTSLSAQRFRNELQKMIGD